MAKATGRLGYGVALAAICWAVIPAMSQTAPHHAAFRLRVGREVIEANASAPALAAAIKAANLAKRIDGLPDALNPDAIDPEKALRFVAGLHRLGARALAPLAGHDLQLADLGLGIQYAAPTQPSAFDRPFTLKVEPGGGAVVFADLEVRSDLALASRGAQDAERRYGALNAQPGPAQTSGDAAMLGRLQRQAVAVVWRLNAQAWADLLPQDAEAKRSLAGALAAVRRSAVAPAGGTVPG